MDLSGFNKGLIDFIKRSPTPFHVVQTMSEALLQAGFIHLDESEVWGLNNEGRYFVCRNGSAIVAFTLGERPLYEMGFKMVGAHTDSPCLKVKPQPDIVSSGYRQLGVEVYGGALLNPWFDRDLSLAGRVTYLNQDKNLVSALLDFERPIAVIPSLAIHLDRKANKERTVNAQKDIPPVLALAGDDDLSFKELLAQQLAQQGFHDVLEVLSHEFCFYDSQAPATVGLNADFIASARLDNLLSCYTGLQALLSADSKQPALLVCNDHEEVGSTSASGAQGPFLLSVLERLCSEPEARIRCTNASMLISADNAHGVHPNYADVHDSNHGPVLNKGPVIKINANQRYASNSETVAVFQYIAQQLNVPVQSFVVRSDMACGSTIGPIASAEIGVKTLDVGVPTFAMHSVRELAGNRDAFSLFQILTRYFEG